MHGRINQRVIAETLGLSQATVSRALSNDGRVAPETRRRVIALCNKMGYVPNHSARSLVQAKSNNIGFAMQAFSVLQSDIIHRVLIDVAERARQEGFTVSLLLLNSIVNQSRAGMIDGVIAFVSYEQYRQFMDYDEAPCPIVLVDCEEDVGRHSRVVFDDFRGAYEATEYLIGLGHRRICYVGTRVSGPGGQRWRGYLQATRDYDLPVVGPVELCGWPQSTDELRAYDDLVFSFRPLPTAYLAASDQIAVALINLAREHGFQVPGELSVVGFNDSPLMDCFEPALTTVRLPVEKMGAAAWDCLSAQLAGKHAPDCVRIRPHLVERRSCTRII